MRFKRRHWLATIRGCQGGKQGALSGPENRLEHSCSRTLLLVCFSADLHRCVFWRFPVRPRHLSPAPLDMLSFPLRPLRVARATIAGPAANGQNTLSRSTSFAMFMPFNSAPTLLSRRYLDESQNESREAGCRICFPWSSHRSVQTTSVVLS